MGGLPTCIITTKGACIQPQGATEVLVCKATHLGRHAPRQLPGAALPLPAVLGAVPPHKVCKKGCRLHHNKAYGTKSMLL